MTLSRKQIEKDYKVDEKGMIRSPGKFELEMIYVPYFWEIYLEGGGEWDEEKGFACIDVLEEDRLIFPELGKRERIRLNESSDGFVGEIT